MTQPISASQTTHHSTQAISRPRTIQKSLALVATITVVGAYIGARLGPPTCDYLYPMHPGERMFYPLRDPACGFVGMIATGLISFMSSSILAVKTFG